MDNLKDYIYVKNAIPKEVCLEVISNLQFAPWQQHTWYNEALQTYKSYDNDFYSTFSDKSEETLRPYIDDFCIDFHKKYGECFRQLSRVKFNRYDVGHSIHKHFDHIQSLFDGVRKGIPIISFIGVLNDGYEGGELVFWDEFEVKLSAGDIVAFPSVFLYPHQVREVKSGSRYSYVSWAI
jgi:hypothetical protein